MQFLSSLVAILNEMSPYILLGFFIAGLLYVFVPPAQMSRHLSGNGFLPVLKATLMGIPLPLCSCGVLPTAVSLRRNGASNAASTAFLIATPQTGVDSIVATCSLLGPAMAVMRPVAALFCALMGGWLVGRIAPTRPADLPSEASNANAAPQASCSESCHARTFWNKLLAAAHYGFVEMVQHVGKWLVIGLVVAALITVLVPDELFVGLASRPLLAMFAMVAVAVPMYICATGSIPIAMSLMLKGLTPGVAFVMLMAGPAANLASMMVLRRSLGNRATAIYILTVVATAIGTGLIIDFLLPSQWFAPKALAGAGCCEVHQLSIFNTICSVLLTAMLFYALITNHLHNKKHLKTEKMKRVYKVSGMMCAHCRSNVEKGLANLAGVEAVSVDLESKTVEVVGEVAPEEVLRCIDALGYEGEAL